jgi:prepilin-type processing-associated H-X9-DG protein
VLARLVPRYAADSAIFICPGGRDAPIPAGESFRLGRISYAYYEGTRLDLPAAVLLSDRQVDTRTKHPDEFVFSPDGRGPGNNHHQYGGNFLFADGSAQSSPAKLSLPLVVVPGAVLLNPKP